MRFTRTHSQSAWVVAVSLVVALASMLIAAPALATAVPGIHAEQFSYDDVPLTYGSAVGVALNQDAEPRVSMVPVTRSEGSVERTSDAVAHVVDSSVDLVAPTSALDDVLPYPTVTDPKLQNYVDNLYKGTTNLNRVGTGTTADAVRNELTTGLPTGGTFHLTKAQETINGLTRWLRNNPDASYSDRLVAQSLLDDLVDAVGTTP